MGKNNCWEIKKCGRNPGGIKVAELGLCPAAVEEKTNGINGGKIQGTYANKLLNCVKCEFYTLVKQEEGNGFCSIAYIKEKLASG
jgi:hypothetical protein